MDPFRFVTDGVVSSAPLRKASRTDHPVCAAFVASRHFLDGAATPPLRGGEYDAFKFRPNSNIIDIWLRRSRAKPFVVRFPLSCAKARGARDIYYFFPSWK